ncbi:MAG: hypothetical protein JWR70_1277 [Modestobacter sp.]|jgi:hypothetical protein|nr:hypothetical protein [Modestobacter sp.]
MQTVTLNNGVQNADPRLRRLLQIPDHETEKAVTDAPLFSSPVPAAWAVRSSST